MTTPAELLALARAGDRRALARLLTVVERGGQAAAAATEAAFALTGHAHVIGVTGAPGTGKSTLAGKLATALEAGGAHVAVVAVDPSSPLTGGAILGDRIRMEDGARPSGVFIRSMASRGHTGGLARAVPGAVRVLDAAGFDTVIVETVGIGQVELDIAAAADTTVVVLTPGWGDAVQANKAGVLEVADVLVVNKADRPGADDAARDLEHMLELGGAAGRVPVIRTQATDGTNVGIVLDAILVHRDRVIASGERDRHRGVAATAEVRALLIDAAAVRVDATLRAHAALLADVAAHHLSPGAAAARLANAD